MDKMMEQLAEKVREVARRDGFRLSLNLSNLERTACAFVAHIRGSQEEEGEEEEEEEENQVPVWVPGQLLLMTPLRLFL